jgi:hypothetical protein
MVLAEYEAHPDTWPKPLQKSLVETGVDQDEEVLRQAQQVMKLVQPQQAAQGKYNIQIVKGKGIVIGDNAQVTQTCGQDEQQLELRARVHHAPHEQNRAGLDIPDEKEEGVIQADLYRRRRHGRKLHDHRRSGCRLGTRFVY